MMLTCTFYYHVAPGASFAAMSKAWTHLYPDKIESTESPMSTGVVSRCSLQQQQYYAQDWDSSEVMLAQSFANSGLTRWDSGPNGERDTLSTRTICAWQQLNGQTGYHTTAHRSSGTLTSVVLRQAYSLAVLEVASAPPSACTTDSMPSISSRPIFLPAAKEVPAEESRSIPLRSRALRLWFSR